MNLGLMTNGQFSCFWNTGDGGGTGAIIMADLDIEMDTEALDVQIDCTDIYNVEIVAEETINVETEVE